MQSTETIERLTITPAEVATALGVSRDELYKRLTSGELPFPVHRIGKLWRIPAKPFYAWLYSNTPTNNQAA